MFLRNATCLQLMKVDAKIWYKYKYGYIFEAAIDKNHIYRTSESEKISILSLCLSATSVFSAKLIYERLLEPKTHPRHIKRAFLKLTDNVPRITQITMDTLSTIITSLFVNG